MLNENSLNVSTVFSVAKVFAIILVILAHSRIVDASVYSIIAERISTIGVITFFFISGYFFNIFKYGLKDFFIKKFKTLIVPWIFLGSLVYIVENKFSFLSWLNWLIGNGTYLYYLTVLLSCYLINALLLRKWYKVLFIILNVISLILTSFGIIDRIGQDIFGCYAVNHYLNVLNWVGFFSLGLLFQTRMEFLLFKLNKNILLIFLLYALFVFISIVLEPSYGGYFSKLSIPLELMGMCLLLAISTLEIFDKPIIHKISGFTFTIYLIHFLVFPFRKILITNHFFQFLNPIIYMLICVAVISIGKKIANVLKLNRLFILLMGVR